MADLEFKIKTPAELQGAEAAARVLEVNIGKAKGLGKEYAALEDRLQTVTASINAFKASLEQSAAATAATDTKKLADESERYAAALEKMDSAAHEAKASQAQQAIDLQAAMQSAGEEVDAAGEKTKLFSGHNKELKKVIQELSREFPLAGLALKAFVTPIGAALTIAVGLFIAIKRQIAETNAALDEMAARNAQPLSDFAESFRNATNEAIASSGEFSNYIKSLGEGAATLKTETDAAVAAIHRLAAAQLEIVSAEEARAIAEINLREEKGQVTAPDASRQRQSVKEFFANQRNAERTAAEDAEIKAREAELAGLTGRLPTLENAAAGDVTGRKTKIADLEKQAAAARQIAEAAAKDLALAENKRDEAQGLVQSRENNPFLQGDPESIARARAFRDQAQQRVDDLQTRQSQAKNLADASERQAANLRDQAKATEDANTQLEALIKEVERLTRELQSLRETQAARRNVSGVEAETRRFEGQTETQKASNKAAADAAREAERRKRKLGQDADRDINAPDPKSLYPTSAAVESLNNAAASFAELTNAVVATAQKMQQQAADTTSKLQDSQNS